MTSRKADLPAPKTVTMLEFKIPGPRSSKRFEKKVGPMTIPSSPRDDGISVEKTMLVLVERRRRK